MLLGAEGHCRTRRPRRLLPFRPRCSVARPRDAIDIGAKVLRMQLDIVNEEVAPLARRAGLEVIMDRCMMIVFARLIDGLGWVGVDAKVIIKKVKVFLVAFFLLGMCSNGYAQKEPPSLPADPLTDEYYQVFRWFYYDSYHLMFEVIGNDTLALPLEDFSKLSIESQYNVCSVGMDYVQFFAATLAAASKIPKGLSGFLLVKIFADLSGIHWDFERQLSEMEKDKIRQIMYFHKNEYKLRIEYIKEKTRYCIENHLVEKTEAYEFTENYTSVPMEFQVRDIYRSQISLIRWLQENLSESEEKDNLQTMVEGMERKYSVF